MSKSKSKVMKFKKLSEHAVIPTQPAPGDAGYDLRATKEITITTGRVGKVPTGLALQLPDGYFAKIFDRSGFFTNVMGAVGAGVIDNGYRGEIIVCMQNATDRPITIQRGEKFAQLVILPLTNFPVVDVDSLEESDRGDSGFGSTGQ